LFRALVAGPVPPIYRSGSERATSRPATGLACGAFRRVTSLRNANDAWTIPLIPATMEWFGGWPRSTDAHSVFQADS